MTRLRVRSVANLPVYTDVSLGDVIYVEANGHHYASDGIQLVDFGDLPDLHHVQLLAEQLRAKAAETIIRNSLSSNAIPISFVRSTGGDYTAATSFMTEVVSNDGGNFCIASIWWLGDSTLRVDTVTDSEGNVWTLIPETLAVQSVSATYPGGVNRQLAYASNVKTSGANTVTVTFTRTSNSYCGFAVHEFSGVTTLDQATSAIGTTSPITGGSLTPTHTHELVFVAQFVDDNGNGPNGGPASGSGYSSLNEHAAGSGAWGAQWKVQEAIALVDGAFEASSNISSFAGSMISVKP